MPTFHEHMSMCQYGDESVYCKYSKGFDDMIAKNQTLESMEGVLAAHVGLIVKDGKRYCLHHIRSVDMPARERAVLEAQANHADYLVSVSEIARQMHQQMGAAQGKSNEHSLKHQLSSKYLDTEFNSVILADWTIEDSSYPPAKYPVICMGVVKAKEGTSAKLLDECVKEFRSLPARFPLLGHVSVGKTDSAPHAGPHHYPPTGVVHWDLGFIFSYGSAHDKRELDSDPEFEAIHKKWRSLLGDNYPTWDLDVHSAAS